MKAMATVHGKRLGGLPWDAAGRRLLRLRRLHLLGAAQGMYLGLWGIARSVSAAFVAVDEDGAVSTKSGRLRGIL